MVALDARNRGNKERGALILNAILILAMASVTAATVLPVFGSIVKEGFELETQDKMEIVVTAITEYYEDNAVFPGNLLDLTIAPEEAGQWMGPYIASKPTAARYSGLSYNVDSWRTEFRLNIIDNWTAELQSYGPDLSDDNGGDDDIVVNFSVHHAAWDTTNSELEVINAAITTYNTLEDVPLAPDTWPNILALLQDGEYIPSGVEAQLIYYADGWNQTYLVTGDPIILSAVSVGPPIS